MKEQDLNKLFEVARSAEPETSPEEVSGWLALAGVGGIGALGLAAKLKLLIAKKSVIMIGSLGIIGVASMGIASLLGPNQQAPKEIEQVSVVLQQEAPVEDNLIEEETVLLAEVEPKEVCGRRGS